jgi:hypothetical protein
LVLKPYTLEALADALGISFSDRVKRASLTTADAR